MKLNKILLPVLFAATLAVVPGCKKETTDSKTLEGYLEVDLPPFMAPGETKTFQIDTMMHLTCPDGDTIGYYFSTSDGTTTISDTLVTSDGVIRRHEFTYTAPDDIGMYTLYLGAYMPKNSAYTGTRTSISTVVVRPGLEGDGSITRFDDSDSDIFLDWRDDRVYYYTTIGNLDWMRQNLAWPELGRAYADCDVMTDVFGRFYTWEEAQYACPDGWRLPTDAEWTALQDGAEAGQDIDGLAGKLMADLYFNGERMWEYWREVKITDALRLSAMPVGYVQVSEDNNDYAGIFAYAVFWTADEAGGEGICRYIYQNQDIVYRGRLSKTDFAASVRCVRE